MGFYLPVIISFISLLGITFYSIFFFTKKKTRLIRNQILSGRKPFLAHWTYESANIGALQGKGSPFKFYKQKLSVIKEIYICTDGILFGDSLFYDWGHFAKYKKLAITTDTPPCLQFKIEFGTFDTETLVEFLIPIPEGKELEAISVVNSLYGKNTK
ncbi:MAG: hypothetical protein Q8934_09840 [Bacillota bacterium]|nr:hypothetical protein [Bacillota bacterium]